jgi:hypothetical protein
VSRPADSDLRVLVAELHAIALSVIRKEGEHAAMFFLRLPGGDLSVRLFDDAERPVGGARAREMADAVRTTGADAVVAVSEAWSAAPERLAAGGLPGDAADATDVLLVAGVDRSGEMVLLTTGLLRKSDGSIEVGKTEEGGRAFFMDEVRAAWGY